MSESNNRPRRLRRWILVAGGGALVFLVVLAWYVNSRHFADVIKTKIVAQLESSTGGRVEIASIEWRLSKLQFDLRGVTIHGLESPNEVPYLHADRIYLRLKVGSVFHRALGLRFIEIERPIVHLIVYPDGTTNQPRPAGKREEAQSRLQTIFEFSINKADVTQGKLLVNDEVVPLDFAASGLDGSMVWLKAEKRYDLQIHVAKVDSSIEGMRPFSAIVDTRISLWQNSAEVKSLKVDSGRSHLEANAKLGDFARPELTTEYRGTIDLADAGSITRIRDLRAGVLTFEGRGRYAPNQFDFRGKTSVRGLRLRESWVQVADASLSSDYAFNNSTMTFSRVIGRVLSGEVSGEAKVENWCGACIAGNKTETGLIRLQLTGASVPQMAAAMSTESLPLHDIKPVGMASGAVVVRWTNTIDDAEVQIDGAAVPPVAGESTGLPVSARLKASYFNKSGEFRASHMLLNTPSTTATASGSISRRSSALGISAETSNLNEFAPLFAAGYGLKQAPFELHGQASFEGKLSGALSSPGLSGHIEVTDFDSDVRARSASQSSINRMHWDRLSCDLEYGPTILMLRSCGVKHGATQVNVDGTAELTQGSLVRTSAVVGRITVSNGQVPDLQNLLGYNYPLTGTADVSMSFSGTRSAPQGSGRAIIRDATFYGERVQQLRADVAFINDDFRFDNIVILPGQGRLTGTARYNFTTRAFRFNLKGSDLAIQDIHAFQKRGLNPRGIVDFTADGSGNPDAPSLNSDLTILGLTVSGEPGRNVTLQTRTVGEVMKLDARLKSGDEEVALTGSVRMRDDFTASAVARFAHVDLRPLWVTYARGRLTGRSSATGELAVSGPLRNWRAMKISGSLSDLFLPVENMNIRNVGEIKASIENNVFTLRQFHIAAEDTDVTASGTAQLGGEQKLDLRAEGRVNLKIIQTMNPDFSSYGTATVNVRLAGDLANPRTNGRIQIANAGVSYIDLPNGLSDINGLLVFNRDRLQIQSLSARTGGGTVNLSGYVTYGRTVSFNLQAIGNDIRLRYPQGISSNANANLKLTGTPSSALLAGDVVITKFGVTPQFDLATYMALSKQPLQMPKPDSPLYNLKLDVHVTSSAELQVQTSLARLSGTVDLRLRGSAARPAVLGRVNIVEGDISFQGTKYHLDRGEITFANPTGITPVFDIAATTRVRDYDIVLGFNGSTDRLSTTYRSDPPLATADIIALLAFGRTREESARQVGANQTMSEQASNVILGQALNATVSSRMQKLFGVSRIKIDPEVGGAENNPSSARVTIEQQVAKDLTITYITDLAKSNQQVISAEYNVTKAVSIVAVRDQYGIVSVNIRVRQRKK